MAAFIRCCFLITIVLPAGMMVFFCLNNPGFLDSFPVFLNLVSLMAMTGVWLAGMGLNRLLPAQNRIKSSLIRWIGWMGQSRVFLSGVGIVCITYIGLFAIASRYDRPGSDQDSPRLVVIGWDGATWDLIDPLLTEGKLPNLQRLMESGGHGVLQSLEPMESPALWTSIATGLPQEKHGVTGFFATRADLAAPRVWDVAAGHGLRTGLYAWLVTWPIHDTFAFVIPSWMARSPETWPPEYACVQELKLDQDRYGGPARPGRALWECARRGARLQGVRRLAGFLARDRWGLSEEERLAAKMLAEVRLETDVFLALLRRFNPDIATFTLYGTDKLAHRFWHYMDPQAFPGMEWAGHATLPSAITDYYQEADRALGRIRGALPDKTHILLLSDHGMKADPAAPRQFFADAPRLLEAIGAAPFFRYSTIQRKIVLDPVISDPGLTQTTVERLRRIRFPGSPDPVFEAEVDEHGRVMLQTAFSLTWNPESPLVKQETILIEGHAFPTRRFFFERTFSGTHDPRGIVVISGPAIVPGSTIQDADLLDIAPTLLYLLDLPISEELPGRILQEAFSTEYRQSHAPRSTPAYPPLPAAGEKPEADWEPFLEQLRGVGYVR